MEKLNPFGSLQRSIEILKTTECSAKEKVTQFGQISESIITVRQGAALATSPVYYGHLTGALGLLLLFCEDHDSSVRMAAEENLSRIVRHCETNGNIVRIQRDLYHEIKKNGHERSLRIALSLFAHYCSSIRPRKARTYAQNLLPCIYSISKRREPALQEGLCAFTEAFCAQLEGYLTDGEVLKMTELFLEDLASECATKRRCAAKNTLSFVKGSRNPEFYANNSFNRCIEQLLKCGQPVHQQPNTVLGVMGCFRGILPIVLQSCRVEKAIETYDLCLHFLREGSHTTINATLEVLLIILNHVQPAVRKVLLSEQGDHRKMLLKRKTLKNSIFKINISESLLSSRKSSTDARSDQLLRPGSLPLTSTPTKFPVPTDDRSLASASDIELDSLKSMELDSESRLAPALQLEQSVSAGGSPCTAPGPAPAPDTLSLRSQKSTDSIGSFLNTLLQTNSNAAESVTKFFRKTLDKPFADDGEEDRLSMDSMASSHISSNAETVRADLDVTLEIDLDTEPPTVATVVPNTTPTPSRDTLEVPLDVSQTVIDDGGAEDSRRELFIGAIYDQNLLEFTARLLCSRFLLAGYRHQLIADSVVRVSVKSLSLQIIAACVRLKPELLCLSLEKDALREEFAVVEILNLEDAINELSEEATACTEQKLECEPTPLTPKPESDLLEMKEDHFGECTSTTYFEYFSPMSLSLDQGLKTKLKSIEENFQSIGNNEKLSRDLDAILSQSEPDTGAIGPARKRELLVVPKVITTIRNEGHSVREGDKISVTAVSVSDRKELEDEPQQSLADVLLFYDNTDPTLRGNVQTIVGHYLRAAIDATGSYREFLQAKVPPALQSFLSEFKLLQIVLKGLSDEIHTVINQSLASVEQFFNAFMLSQDVSDRNDVEPTKATLPKGSGNVLLDDRFEPVSAHQSIGSVRSILNQLTTMTNTKYWLVQCKLYDVIVQLDFQCIEALGLPGYYIRDQFLDQLLAGLGDSDIRVRNHAADRILLMLETCQGDQWSPVIPSQTTAEAFVNEYILSTFAQPFDRGQYPCTNRSLQEGKSILIVRMVMYKISNHLLRISDKNLQSGILHFLWLFISKYNPLLYVDLWNEYNMLNVLLSLLLEMSGMTVLDVTLHTYLLQICSHLTIAVFSSRATSTPADGDTLNKFIIHLLKVLNIYHHLFTNLTPIVINRMQKADLFMNSKELQQINCFGYFGGEPVYMKLYYQVRSSLESYRITINADAGTKLFDCLRASIKALWTLLEMKSISTMTNGMKFVEEVLRYLHSFIALEPEHCVRCTRFLLKFIFQSNFVNRSAEISFFQRATEISEGSELISKEFYARYYDFCKPKHKSASLEIGAYVKLFEPLVIACLKMFGRVQSSVQADILEMLCQLLDFNINYQLLDASSIFVETILKHVEYIERGTVDDAEHLMRQVVRFLFKLSALNRDKPMVTVPKIINICDNLLANHLIRQTAIASVKALSHEVFLLCSSNDSGISSKGFELTECCTQKEVVMNMLIKFPEELEVYHILPMIVYSERWYDAETGQDASCEPDILAALLQALDSGKLVVGNERAYSNLAQLMGCLSANLLLESKTMLRFIEILYSTMSNDSLTAHQRVIHAELIVRYVFLRTEECFLLHHVELYHCKAHGTGSSGDRSNELVQKATQSLVDILIRYLRECFARIEELQLMQISTVEELKFAENTVRRYIQALGSMKTFTGISRVLVEQIPLELICWRRLSPCIARPLTELLVNHGYDSEVVLTLLRNATYNVRNDRLVTLMMEVLLENNPNESKWRRSDVLVFLKSESRLLLQDFHTFLLCQITDDEFCKHIVMAIASNMRAKISSAEFKLLEKSPLNTLRLMSDRLGDLLGAVNIVTSRKAALILGHKLDALLLMNTDSDRETVIAVLPETNYTYLLSQLSADKRRKFPKLFKSVLELLRHYDSSALAPTDIQSVGPSSIDVEALTHETIDDAWYLRQVTYHCTTRSYTKARHIAALIHEIKSESKLINLLSTDALNVRLLRDVLSVAFDNMFRTFCTDCVQYNPHLNYLKVHPMLKVALIVLMRKLKECGNEVTVQHEHCAEVIICFLEYLKRLEHLCLFYIEGKFIDRFMKEHLLKANFFETILTFGSVCARAVLLEPPSNITRIELYLSCINAILHQRALWNELNQNDRYRDDAVLYMNTIYTILERSLHDSQFPQRHRHPEVFDPFVAREDGTIDVYLKAIFLAELLTDRDTMGKQLSLGVEMLTVIQSIGIALLKLDRFYLFALTPTELYASYGSLEELENGDPKLPKVPIEHLYDIELLELFLKRVNLVGYASRQQFEELLMCLMVLINRTEEDALLVSLQEQREIKNVCLHAVTALLVSCYRYPWIGFSGGKFHHSTRNPTIACNRIGLKKLHNIQLLIPLSNVFYQPNLERRLMITVMDDLHSTGDSSVGTMRFDRNQLALKHFWEIIERWNESDGRSTAVSLSVRNWQYFVEKINIDVTSSMQLIYGVLEQLLEGDPSLVLPHLLSFCEIIDNREQIRWLNTLLLKLQERIPMEDTLSQQHIIYLLCRLSALLVPSMTELTHLCTIIPSYLKSTQLYIRNATLQGLISLLECLVQTNSSIGSLNDELQLVRNITVNYIIKHGIIEESSGAFSDLHTKLVWTLNFYLIEHTSRFVPDCNLLSNSIISANNILKRTTNLDIYLCILNGLERLVIRGAVPRMLHDKIEKLAIDLVKIDNEMFSLSALKLLVTCIYTSCNEQLESTERCNGIVQDEPDIIVQQIEKIEILFAKIRSTTPQGAKVFGDVLCQLIRDLLPPNEIITKVFKELMMNQPNPDIIATVTFQLFRSAIDASYLSLLQEWLLCSLPNFLAFPQVNKSVWCLTVIFLSASLNHHLIKLLPEVLSLPSYQQLNEREINNFILSAKDFYSRLEPNSSQRSKFKEMFQQHESFVFQSLVRCL